MMIKIANFLKNLKKDDKGFTLIELMVVIAVLGILAALIIPQFSNVNDKAKLANAKSTAQAIATAASMVYAENNIDGNAIKAEIPNYMSNYNSIVTQYGDANIVISGGTVTVTDTTADPDVQGIAKYY